MVAVIADQTGGRGSGISIAYGAASALILTIVAMAVQFLLPDLPLYAIFALAMLIVALPLLLFGWRGGTITAMTRPGDGWESHLSVPVAAETAEPLPTTEEIERLKALVKEIRRPESPEAWADGQLELADALRRLGTDESRRASQRDRKFATSRLRQAAAAYRRSLQHYRQDANPAQWSTAILGLARSVSLLGELERSPEYVEEAITAFNSAIDADSLLDTQRAIAMEGLGQAENLLRGLMGVRADGDSDPF